MNRFTEACVKSVKHVLQHAKYSGSDLQLALLALQATPIDTKLPSPTELLYQHQCRTTTHAKIHNTDPATLQVCEWVDTHSDAFKAQVDKHCKPVAPLYASQPVAMYDTLHKIWIPATVVHVLPKDSYQVCTSDGTVYYYMKQHLHEHSVKPTDTVPDTITATPQAPSRPHISASQHAPTKLAQLAEPSPVAPTMPDTPKPQTTAVPTIPAVPKVALHLCL